MPETIDLPILALRRHSILIDADLARLYGVTKALNQAVLRNADRFPEDFRFQLSASEKAEVVTKRDHLKTLLVHDTALRDLYQKLLPLLQPPPAQSPRRIGFHSRLAESK
jgi:hypothetical protein